GAGEPVGGGEEPPRVDRRIGGPALERYLVQQATNAQLRLVVVPNDTEPLRPPREVFVVQSRARRRCRETVPFMRRTRRTCFVTVRERPGAVGDIPIGRDRAHACRLPSFA